MGDIIYLNQLHRRGGVCMDNIYEVAKYFLAKDSMSHKKLQKLCYYAQAWSLALTNVPLMGTYFEAWIHGPVSPELYQEYKEWGWANIPQQQEIAVISQKACDFADTIFQIYGDMSGDQLEELTHSESPWKNARRGYKRWENCTNIISETDMKEFYKQMLKERKT